MRTAVLVERAGPVLLISINRPAVRNAINREVGIALSAAVDELDATPELSVGILTGSGGNFCAGMDLKAFAAGEVIAVPGRGLGFTNRPPRKPMIAAVEGFALAGGTELVLACDLVVAARTAVFGIPEVKRGLVAGAGGLIRLQQRIPRQVAYEYALTGDNFSAPDAHRFGMVNHLTEPDGALTGALALAARITANGPLAVAVTKEVMTASADWSIEEAFARQQDLIEPVLTSADALEGATAFTEKRAPVWTGR